MKNLNDHAELIVLVCVFVISIISFVLVFTETVEFVTVVVECDGEVVASNRYIKI